MNPVATLLTRRWLAFGLALVISLPGLAAVAGEGVPRLAIKGYDPVSYFSPGKPMPGSADISYEWDGARWQFADAAHRELFQSNPDAYAPQYGGYCMLWAIVDGKLYLTYDQESLNEWRQNQAANIAQADRIWAEQQH